MIKFRQLTDEDKHRTFLSASRLRNVHPSYAFSVVEGRASFDQRLEVRTWLIERFGENNYDLLNGSKDGYYFTNSSLYTFDEAIAFEFKMRWC